MEKLDFIIIKPRNEPSGASNSIIKTNKSRKVSIINIQFAQEAAIRIGEDKIIIIKEQQKESE